MCAEIETKAPEPPLQKPQEKILASRIMDTMAEDLNYGILKELECPVCLEYMQPPIILICNNGHNVCNTCAPLLQECPTCRNTVVRIKNVALDNIARKTLYHCTNRKWGCNELYPLELIPEHQAVCIQVPRNCPFASPSQINCSWKGPTKIMRKHLTDAHKRDTITVPDGEKVDLFTELNKTIEIALEKIIITYKEMFYVRSGVTGDNFYSIVRYIDVNKVAPKFKYEFFVKNNGGNESITINNVACSITEDFGEIKQSGKCVLIPYNVLQNYIQVVHVYNLMYCIKITIITE